MPPPPGSHFTQGEHFDRRGNGLVMGDRNGVKPDFNNPIRTWVNVVPTKDITGGAEGEMGRAGNGSTSTISSQGNARFGAGITVGIHNATRSIDGKAVIRTGHLTMAIIVGSTDEVVQRSIGLQA